MTDQPAWKRSGGRDHILPVHHPWSFKSVRRHMKTAIWLLPDMDSTGNWFVVVSALSSRFKKFMSLMWLPCADFRYKPGQVYLEKDLILPYVANVDFCKTDCLRENESKRSTLLFFRGRLKRNAVRYLLILVSM